MIALRSEILNYTAKFVQISVMTQCDSFPVRRTLTHSSSYAFYLLQLAKWTRSQCSRKCLKDDIGPQKLIIETDGADNCDKCMISAKDTHRASRFALLPLFWPMKNDNHLSVFSSGAASTRVVCSSGSDHWRRMFRHWNASRGEQPSWWKGWKVCPLGNC